MAKKDTSDQGLAKFEKHFDDLNQLVDQMEKGGLSLEQSLNHFERGVQLVRECNKVLQTAEQKVEQLIEEADDEYLEDFSFEEESE